MVDFGPRCEYEWDASVMPQLNWWFTVGNTVRLRPEQPMLHTTLGILEALVRLEEITPDDAAHSVKNGLLCGRIFVTSVTIVSAPQRE